jgi:hypothetical protein
MYNKYETNGMDVTRLHEITGALSKATLVPFNFTFGGIEKECKELVGVYNYSQDKMATSVSKDYNLLLHQDYFNVFADSLNNLGMKYTMKIFEQGHKAYADIAFEGQNLKYEKLGEEFITGIIITNSYNKTTGINIMPKFTRLACMNGMVMSRFGQTLNLRHNSGLVHEISVFIERRLNDLINKYSELEKYVSESMKDSIEWLSACKIMAQFVKNKKHREEIFRRLDVAYIVETDKDNKLKNISFIQMEANKKPKFTRWELYNAITHYCTYGEQLSPIMEETLQNKAQEILTTDLETMPMLETLNYSYGVKK